MKNRGLTIVLILVVGFIWYKVFVRVKSSFDAKELVLNNTQQSSVNYQFKRPKAFHLDANYRDPFLGKGAVKTEKKDPNLFVDLVPKEPKPKPTPPVVYWSDIKYFGFVRNTTSSQARVIVSVDGNLFKIKVGESILDNLKLVSANRNEVKMLYKGETRVFRK
jgi:hypothetical protein